MRHQVLKLQGVVQRPRMLMIAIDERESESALSDQVARVGRIMQRVHADPGHELGHDLRDGKANRPCLRALIYGFQIDRVQERAGGQTARFLPAKRNHFRQNRSGKSGGRPDLDRELRSQKTRDAAGEKALS